MKYFECKADLAHIVQFRESVIAFWSTEDDIEKEEKKSCNQHLISGQGERNISPELQARHQDAREKVARGMLSARKIAIEYGISTNVQVSPPPIMGGLVLSVNIFDEVLNGMAPYGYRAPRQLILDSINKVIGSCEEKKGKAFNDLVNPLNWIQNLIRLILRFPVYVIMLAGVEALGDETNTTGKWSRIVILLLWWTVGLPLLTYHLGIDLGIEKDDIVSTIKENLDVLFTK